MLDAYDVRVFLSPPEEIRRQWKVSRDCSRRGYTTDQVLADLDKREPDSEAFIRPQRRYADIVVSFVPGESEEPDHLDAHVILGPGLPHPDLTPVVTDEPGGIQMVEQGEDRLVVIPGRMDPVATPVLEEAIWQRMHFASHLRSGRLGEFTIGTQLYRSESLALVQLLVLYHLVTAKAAVALGGAGARNTNGTREPAAVTKASREAS
jgi:phosphoribulokinase